MKNKGFLNKNKSPRNLNIILDNSQIYINGIAKEVKITSIEKNIAYSHTSIGIVIKECTNNLKKYNGIYIPYLNEKEIDNEYNATFICLCDIINITKNRIFCTFKKEYDWSVVPTLTVEATENNIRLCKNRKVEFNFTYITSYINSFGGFFGNPHFFCTMTSKVFED